MAQFFVIFLGFLVGLSYPVGIEPLLFKPLYSVLGVLFITILYPLIGSWLIRRGQYRQGRDKLITLYRFSLLFWYACEIYLLHWPLLITYTWNINIILITELLVLLPFFIGLILFWIPLWKLDRLNRSSTWTLKEYMIFHFRSSVLVVIMPIGIMILLSDIVTMIPALNKLVFIYPFSVWVAVLFFAGLLYIFSPLYLKMVWRLSPLPAGPLRTRLENMVKASGLKIRDLMVWQVGGGRLCNALIMGLIPRQRYIVFTDTLLNYFSPEEVEAVLGHEIGHARNRHLFWYFLLALVYICIALFISESGGDDTLTVNLRLLGWVFIFWGVLFKILARRFEHQADLYSARLLNTVYASPIIGFDYMMGTLEKLALINGQSRTLKDLMHPSVDQRVDFLGKNIMSREAEERLIKGTRRFLAGTALVFCLLSFGMIKIVREQGGDIRIREAKWQAGAWATQADSLLSVLDKKPNKNPLEYNQAIELLGQAIACDHTNPYYYIFLGDALSGQAGRLTPEARIAYNIALRCNPVDPVQRMHLSERLRQQADSGPRRHN
jgi:Zn-dependent protease with chaperone function